MNRALSVKPILAALLSGPAALDQYRDALQFMREASLPPEEVERIMSSGMPVPTPDTAYRPPVDEREFAGFIDVEFELNKFGMATDPHSARGKA